MSVGGGGKVSSDLVVLKRLQELQNETLVVLEEIVMSNAMELVSRNKYTVAVRQDIARLQTQLADGAHLLQRLDDELQRHRAEHDAGCHHRQPHIGLRIALLTPVPRTEGSLPSEERPRGFTANHPRSPN